MIYDLLWLISAYYDLRIMTISLSKLLELLILCKFVNKKWRINNDSNNNDNNNNNNNNNNNYNNEE